MTQQRTQANIDNDYEIAIERRAELSAKVAVLEERSINNKENLDKFSNQFLLHSKHDEILLTEVEEALRDVGKSLDNKLITELKPVIQDVSDIKKEITKAKTIIWVLSGVGGFIVGLILFFKEIIITWITHTK
jgi:hypothetical protein